MQKNVAKLKIGIVLMLLSAFFTSTGQLMWKLAPSNNSVILLYIIGILLYGIGALLMIVAFKFGEMSVLHPMLSAGFIIALIYGSIFLSEKIRWQSIVGTALIFIGMFFLGKSAKGDDI